MKKKVIIIILIVFAVAAAAGAVIAVSSPLPEEAERIEIQNGNTGEEFMLNEEEKAIFLKGLSETNTRVSSIRIFTAGYQYKITFSSGIGEKEVVVKNSELLESGGLMYKADRDMIKLIESVLSEITNDELT